MDIRLLDPRGMHLVHGAGNFPRTRPCGASANRFTVVNYCFPLNHFTFFHPKPLVVIGNRKTRDSSVETVYFCFPFYFPILSFRQSGFAVFICSMSRDYILQSFHPPVELQIDYARELNEQQHAAVTALPGPALVIAGAGSGKTRTLTYRVAYLLEQGIPPDRILLLTFTNKAAGEMMRRVADLLGGSQPGIWGGTFHSIGARVLRTHAELLGFHRDFTILDRDDARDLVKTCVAEAGIDKKDTSFPKPDVLVEIFSMAGNTHRSVLEMIDAQYGYFAEHAAKIEELAKAYTSRKRANNSMDFDDLLQLWLKLLQEHAAIREHYQKRFQFILVDEYQDTNKLQSDLIDLLAARHKNVMVVGDDAQSIYGWRGANFLNIMKFPDRYPGAKVFKIETNYRSTPEILNLANAVIAANVNQFAKELAPARKSGIKPALVACADTGQQSAFIAQRIGELHEEGVSLDEIAVLYRSHFHALELQLEFTRRQIPFTITSGIRFFEQAHIKDATAYLKFVANPRDEISFKRLVQLMPGIAGKGADKLWPLYVSCLPQPPAPPPVPDVPEFLPEEPAPTTSPATPPGMIARALQACAKAVPAKAAVPWAQWVATIAQLDTEANRQSPAKMLEMVLDAGYADYLKASYDNHSSRLDDLEQLAVFAKDLGSLDQFLTQLALLTNVEAEDDKRTEKDEQRVRLSTIHQAKGLEFGVVFVIMLCDGMFPSSRSIEATDGEEEERRLFYVAVTRAKDELYLSYPFMRGGFGDSGVTVQSPSRFLNEIPRELIEELNLRPSYY
jgi:DNA helicase-2/ATP-dependent DNA helicase PcrA